MARMAGAAFAAALITGALAAPASAGTSLCVLSNCTPVPVVDSGAVNTVAATATTPCVTLARVDIQAFIVGSHGGVCKVSGSEWNPQRVAFAEFAGPVSASATHTSYTYGCDAFERTSVTVNGTEAVRLHATPDC